MVLAFEPAPQPAAMSASSASDVRGMVFSTREEGSATTVYPAWQRVGAAFRGQDATARRAGRARRGRWWRGRRDRARPRGAARAPRPRTPPRAPPRRDRARRARCPPRLRAAAAGTPRRPPRSAPRGLRGRSWHVLRERHPAAAQALGQRLAGPADVLEEGVELHPQASGEAGVGLAAAGVEAGVEGGAGLPPQLLAAAGDELAEQRVGRVGRGVAGERVEEAGEVVLADR